LRGADPPVVLFEFSAALGGADFDPVGRPVAGAREALQLHERLDLAAAAGEVAQLGPGHGAGPKVMMGLQELVIASSGWEKTRRNRSTHAAGERARPRFVRVGKVGR